MAFATSLKGNRHLQGNVQVYNVKMPNQESRARFSPEAGNRQGLPRDGCRRAVARVRRVPAARPRAGSAKRGLAGFCRNGCGSKIGTQKWNPGKWNQGLKPAAPWFFNFDPCPNLFGRGQHGGFLPLVPCKRQSRRAPSTKKRSRFLHVDA